MHALAARRACRRPLLTLALLLIVPAAFAAPPDASIVTALAPTGALRASINLGNPVLAKRVAGDARPVGVSIDLAERLADRLGVPLTLVVQDGAGKSVDAVANGSADIGFFAIDPQRAASIAFTAPYLLIEGSYLVRADSAIVRNEDVDVPGRRVVVGRASAYDLFLARELKHAELIRAPTSPSVVRVFLDSGADVAAGVRQQLSADASDRPELRVLDGRFMVIEQAMAMPTVRGAAAATFLRAFVEEMKASGFVASSLARHGIDGAIVAPAAR